MQAVVHDLGIAGDDVGTLFGAHSRVFEKTASVADLRRVGQFGAADLTYPVKKLLGAGIFDAGLGLLFLQVSVAQHRLPIPGQRKPHPQNHGPALQTHVALGSIVFEHRVAVTETTLRSIQREDPAGLQIDGVEGFKPVL